MLQVKKRNKQENLAFHDDANYFSSTYTEFHNKNLNEKHDQKQGFTPAELRQQLVELQASHLEFGSDADNFGTSNSNAFTNKISIYEKAGPPIDLNKTNYYPGDDAQPTESVYRHFHKQFPISKAALNEDLKKDLRGIKILQYINFLAHHFKYGDVKQNYETEHKKGFPEYDLTKAGNQGDNPLLYQNHFHFGDDKPEMKSLYKATHVELPVKQQERHNHTKRDRSSNIVLGYSNDQLKSEARSK